jgi:carbamoyl-phosphate synthase large subunit
MPKRTDVKKILVIGSGPIQIGQAAEFDYSGSQACLSLREEGYETVLINNNPATIQTDTDIADVVYLEPITVETIEKIIQKEKPDGVLPTMGGQTGLNMAIELDKAGIFEKYNLKILGTSIETIKNAEGREEFAALMGKIGEPICKSHSVFSLHEAEEAVFELGYPVIIRPGYTLGGTGGGIAYSEKDLAKIVQRALSRSKNGEALVEKYIGGWKEIEYEVMRDSNNNCITICNMENFDPMGIHTGESIVVAPTQTLNDTEYQLLRSASLNIIRALGVEGGCNVQLALHPTSMEYRVIEVNPRVSRSSALASKATGYPIARVAAKIAIGMTLDEIPNEVTKTTPASFEPALDYIVTKMPRWPFDKFKAMPRNIGTEMKSTGEVMGIGRTFEESLQKAIRSLDQKRMGICADGRKNCEDDELIKEKLSHPTDERIYYVYDALRKGWTCQEVHEVTKIDLWFLEKLMNIVKMEKKLSGSNLSLELLRKSKRMGFSDRQLSKLTGMPESKIREMRFLECRPTYKMVDTCAAEFEAKTPYYYSSYEDESESAANDKKKVIILGSGPIRIGQGVEFDYCTVHAVLALRELGYEAIAINNNPETVSTDFDTSDKLYFEPLTEEDVLNVVETENKTGKLLGVFVQFGGQTAINISKGLVEGGVKILGTDSAAIDLAENRDQFGKLLEKLEIPAPKWGTAMSFEGALEIAHDIGYPVLVRPSYVLGGRAMEIVFDDDELESYMREATDVSPEHPILVDDFLDGAIELDVDAVCDGEDVYIGGIMEHIEEAGIHSGDSCCVVPPQTLDPQVIEVVKDYTKRMALGLNTRGLINIQYAVKDSKVYVIEANPRSSRTIPFISKATGVPLAKIAVRVIMGEKLKDILESFDYTAKINHVAVKEVVLPFDKLRIDPILSPEMRSTGESMGIDHNFGNAYYKAQQGAGIQLPDKGNVFFSIGDDREKEVAADLAGELASLGFSIYATEGTLKVFKDKGLNVKEVKKVSEGSPNAVDLIEGKRLQFIVNVPKKGTKAREDEKRIRFAILDYDIPYVTTIAAAKAAIAAIRSAKEGNIDTISLNDYFKP